jgi:hypothetical protein
MNIFDKIYDLLNTRIGAAIFLIASCLWSGLVIYATVASVERGNPWWLTGLFGLFACVCLLETYLISFRMGYAQFVLTGRKSY